MLKGGPSALVWLTVWVLLTALGCQTAQQRSENLVRERITQLKPLSKWNSMWCEVETKLTEPARARYAQMFPDEAVRLGEEAWGYTWKSRETTCEITPLNSSPAVQSHQSFLETSVCMLMQVFYVNSPFDELPIQATDVEPLKVEAQKEVAKIRAGPNPDVGIFLPNARPTGLNGDGEAFSVETRTRKHGVLAAVYQSKNDGPWLPTSFEQRRDKTLFVVDAIEFDPYMMNGGSSDAEVFWISIGGEKPLRHSQVTFNNCRAL